mgnify:CR=1 FL=1
MTDIPMSQRARQVTPFLAMEIMERAKILEQQGRSIIYLCLGEPDFATPQPIIDAATEAMACGETLYTHSLGRLELRETISSYYLKRYGVQIEPEQVLVSSGTSPLMLLLFSALCEKGDEIILSDPGYACYPNFIRFAGATPRFVPTREEDGFQPRAELIAPLLNEQTRGILLNSPQNPTGAVLSAARLKELAELGAPLISDEIYHGLTYEGEEHSALEFSDRAFVLGGFSKSYAMTGWRLGYLITPRSAVRTLQSLHQNFMISANSFVQLAGVTALRNCQQDVAKMRAEYDRRRKHIVPGLERLGLSVRTRPQGAFYVLADARHIRNDSLSLAKEILEETGVAVTPGIDFGAGAEGFLRFSYANSIENIDEALSRLAQLFDQRGWL